MLVALPAVKQAPPTDVHWELTVLPLKSSFSKVAANKLELVAVAANASNRCIFFMMCSLFQRSASVFGFSIIRGS